MYVQIILTVGKLQHTTYCLWLIMITLQVRNTSVLVRYLMTVGRHS